MTIFVRLPAARSGKSGSPGPVSLAVTWDQGPPSVFRFLEALPRTHSGKIDRLALASLQAPSSTSPEPATDRERALAEIWSDVLGVERVGRGDDFFELGGDSITAFRMIGRARASGIHISVARLFAHPTLADLAELEEGAAGARSDVEDVGR